MASVIAIIFLILSSSFVNSISSPISIGSRSILRLSNSDEAEKNDLAVELNATNFDAVLKETPAIYAVVEFFAYWCPACRHYKPQYEKVAKLFNGVNAVHPGIILMTRVDCALKININLCNKFSVEHYPTLLWGLPSKFVSVTKHEKSGIYSVDDGRTADRLLNWINKKMNSSYSFDDKKYENEHLQTNVSDPGQRKISRAIYDIEEATFTAFDIIFKHKMIKSETRPLILKFFQLLMVHHPSRRCRKGIAQILVDFEDFSAKTMEAASDGESNQICGKDVPHGYWIFCHGSKNDTRGFSCGLWVLLHSLSVRVGDGESHTAFTTICDFIHNFFVCEECRLHFYGMCSSVSNPFKKAREFTLWLWDAHNKVNERLMKEEASHEADDPKYPKMIWPPPEICPSCYLNKTIETDGDSAIKWDDNEVYKFLVNYYGRTLSTQYTGKELFSDRTDGVLADYMATTAHAVMVPVGAALAIAIASCAFGALACYWRQQQKNRKPKRSWK